MPTNNELSTDEIMADLEQHTHRHEQATAAVTNTWPDRIGPVPDGTETISVRAQTEHLAEIEKDLTGRGVPEDLIRLGFLILHRQQPQPYGIWAENCAAAYAAVLEYDRRQDAAE